MLVGQKRKGGSVYVWLQSLCSVLRLNSRARTERKDYNQTPATTRPPLQPDPRYNQTPAPLPVNEQRVFQQKSIGFTKYSKCARQKLYFTQKGGSISHVCHFLYTFSQNSPLAFEMFLLFLLNICMWPLTALRQLGIVFLSLYCCYSRRNCGSFSLHI